MGTKKSYRAPKPHASRVEIIAYYDRGMTDAQIALAVGVPQRTVRREIELEDTRRAERATAPAIAPETLSLTAQQKLDLAIRQHKEKLDTEWRVAVNTRVKEFLADTIGPSLQREQNQARAFMKSRKGVMDRKTYRKIWACLHPDRISDPEMKPLYEEAFRLFTAAEKLLLDETSSPTDYAGIPKTAAEWDELRRQATAARHAKRVARKGIQKA